MWRWLTLGLLFSCTNSPRGGAARSAAPAAPLPSLRARFHLPALAADKSLVITQVPGPKRDQFYPGAMAIDGHVTAAGWTGRPPEAHLISPGRWLLYDSYDGNFIWIWESGPRRLTELGRGTIWPQRGAGYLIELARGDEQVYYDVDPDRPALHELFVGGTPLGLSGDELVIYQPGTPGRAVFSTLNPSGKRTLHEVAVGDMGPADQVRGTQVLLISRLHFDQLRDLDFDVAIADFVTGQVRPAGHGVGCMSTTTNAPHLMIGARWASSDTGHQGWSDRCDLVVPDP